MGPLLVGAPWSRWDTGPLCVDLSVGLYVGSVWACGRPLCGVSVGTLSGGPQFLSVLHFRAGEGLRDLLLLISCCSARVLPCHFSPQGLGFSCPHPQRSLLSASKRTGQQPGSGSMLCVLSPDLWRSLCGLGPSPSFRPWLSSHCCAHPGGWGPGRPWLQKEPTAQADLCPLPHTTPVLVSHSGVLTGTGQPHSCCLLDQRPLLEQVSLLQ